MCGDIYIYLFALPTLWGYKASTAFKNEINRLSSLTFFKQLNPYSCWNWLDALPVIQVIRQPFYASAKHRKLVIWKLIVTSEFWKDEQWLINSLRTQGSCQSELRPAFESAFLLMVNLVCSETPEKSSTQPAHLHLPCPHSPLGDPSKLRLSSTKKTVNCICTSALTNSENKISSSHRENSPYLDVPSAIGKEPRPSARSKVSLPWINTRNCLWSLIPGGQIFRVTVGWRRVVRMEKSRQAGVMYKPHLWIRW